MAGTLYPPIPSPVVGENGRITREWSQFFVSLMAQIGPLSSITDLTGDVTATGPGSAVAAIAPGVIVDADVNAAAAIAWSKLDTAGQVVNASVNASAAIALSKLASQSALTIVANATAGAAVPTAVAGNLGASVVYTPSWTTSGGTQAVGNGTLTGNYIQIGKLVLETLDFTIGSSTNVSTGAWIFGHAVTAADSKKRSGTAIATTGGANYQGVSVQLSTTTFAAVTTNVVSGTGFQSNTPFVWAAGDTLSVTNVYEAA